MSHTEHVSCTALCREGATYSVRVNPQGAGLRGQVPHSSLKSMTKHKILTQIYAFSYFNNSMLLELLFLVAQVKAESLLLLFK